MPRVQSRTTRLKKTIGRTRNVTVERTSRYPGTLFWATKVEYQTNPFRKSPWRVRSDIFSVFIRLRKGVVRPLGVIYRFPFHIKHKDGLNQ